MNTQRRYIIISLEGSGISVFSGVSIKTKNFIKKNFIKVRDGVHGVWHF